MRRDTLLDFFHDFAVTRGEFLVYDDGYRSRSYTYGETAKAARAFAAKLQAAGIGKSDKVVFWSENRPEWIIALWGCLLNGSIAVPIDYRASHDFLNKVARIVDAKVLLVGDDVDDVTTPGTKIWKLRDIDWKHLSDATFTPVPIVR
ncbi:MAG: AMP-binding protein, partial [Betaproteobacteria bacterium]